MTSRGFSFALAVEFPGHQNVVIKNEYNHICIQKVKSYVLRCWVNNGISKVSPKLSAKHLLKGPRNQ